MKLTKDELIYIQTTADEDCKIISSNDGCNHKGCLKKCFYGRLWHKCKKELEKREK